MFRHKIDCPICRNERKDCRSLEELIFCRSGEAPPPGWRFIKEDALGFGMYAEGESGKEIDYLALDEKRALREAERLAALAGALSAPARDTYYRDKTHEARLAPEHRADLERRGLSAEDIASLPIWSAPKFGYGVAFPDLNGFLHGAQWRVDDAANGGKYIWNSGLPGKQKLAIGEMPIAIYKVANPSCIILVEGTGIKPFIAGRKLNAIAIGASGGQHNSAPIQMAEALAAYPGLPIFIVPDAGDIVNVSVMQRHRKLVDTLPQAKFFWWGQETISHEDIDENIDPQLIQAISAEAFFALDKSQANKYKWAVEASRPKQNQRPTLISPQDREMAIKAEKKFIDSIAAVNLGEYLNWEAILSQKMHVPAQANTWSVHKQDTHNARNSKEIWLTAQGFEFAGKTGVRIAPSLEASQLIIDRLKLATKIFYAPHQQLLINRLQRMGVKAIFMLSDDTGLRPLQFDREYRKRILKNSRKLDQEYLQFGDVFNPDRVGGYVLCLKSPMGTGKTTVIKNMLDIYRQNGAVINLADISHRISLAKASSKTYETTLYSEKSELQFEKIGNQGEFAISTTVDSIGSQQVGPAICALIDKANVLILDEVESTLSHCANSVTLEDKRLICQQEILKHIKAIIDAGGMVIAADANLSQNTVNLLADLVGADRLEVVENTRYKIKADVVVAKSAQQNLAILMEKLEKGERIFVACDSVDSEKNTSTKNIEALALTQGVSSLEIKRIDSHTMAIGETLDIPDEIRLVICSPSVESGLSVVSHFDAVFGFFSGNADILSSMQMLGRVRSHCNRYVFLRGSGSADNAGKSDRQLVEARNDQFLEEYTALKAEDSQAKEVREWGENTEAFMNAGRNGLKFALPWLLNQAQGWNVRLADESDGPKTTAIPYQQIFADRFAQEYKAIAAAPAITAEVAKRLREGRDNIDETQRLSIERAGIASSVNVCAEDIGVEESAYLYKKTCNQFGARGNQLLISSIAREEALNKNAKKLKAGIERKTKDVCLLRVVQNPEVRDLIDRLMELSQEQEFSSQHPTVKAIGDLMRTMPEEMRVLGMSKLDLASDMKITMLIMNRFGFTKIAGKRTNSQRFYRFEHNPLIVQISMQAINYMGARLEETMQQTKEILEDREIISWQKEKDLQRSA